MRTQKLSRCLTDFESNVCFFVLSKLFIFFCLCGGNMKNLYCIVGPSGSGKTTVLDALREKYGYKVIESYTTRPPRYPGEKGYHFVSEEEFRSLGKMFAYTKFDEHEYGVTAEALAAGDLYILDPVGAALLREEYQGEKEVQVIGLSVSEVVCRHRMKNRGDSEDKINRRLANDFVAFRNLGQLSDIFINAEGPVGPICECIHEFIGVKERQAEALHKFYLRDAEDNVVSIKRFYNMEEAVEAFCEKYPEGLPAGWCVVEDIVTLQVSHIDSLIASALEHSCALRVESMKSSETRVDMDKQ